MIHVHNLESGDRLMLGDDTIKVTNVVVDDSLGRTYFEYKHLDSSECSICGINRRHRLHPHATRKWSKSGYLMALDKSETETA